PRHFIPIYPPFRVSDFVACGFRDVLGSKIDNETPTPLRAEFCRAGRWHDDNGLRPLEAPERSATGAPDPALAGRLLDHPGRRQPERHHRHGVPQSGLVAMANGCSSPPTRAAATSCPAREAAREPIAISSGA